MSKEKIKNLISSSEVFSKEITDLEVLGYYLYREVEEMPDSEIRRYLKGEIREEVGIEGMGSFYIIKSKIENIIMMIENMSWIDEVLRMLNEMKISVTNLIKQIEELRDR